MTRYRSSIGVDVSFASMRFEQVRQERVGVGALLPELLDLLVPFDVDEGTDLTTRFSSRTKTDRLAEDAGPMSPATDGLPTRSSGAGA